MPRILFSNFYSEMNNYRPLFSHPLLLLFSILLVLMINFPVSTLSINWFSICGSRFTCGNIVDVYYPFWGGERLEGCGHPQLKLTCDANGTTTIDINDVKYHVLELNQSAQILKIARADFSSGICYPEFGSSYFDSTLFSITRVQELTFFYDCAKSNDQPFFSSYYFTCPDGSAYKDGYLLSEPNTEIGICNSSVTVGVSLTYFGDTRNFSMIEKALREGLEVNYTVGSSMVCRECTSFNRVCAYDLKKAGLRCYCPDQSSGFGTCTSNSTLAGVPLHKTASSSKRNWTIGISSVLSGIMIIGVVIVCVRMREYFYIGIVKFWNKERRSDQFDVEAFLRNNRSFAPTRYNYSNVKKMTNSFAEKIGSGGYGSVYKGKLPTNGRLVAVKVLNAVKGTDGEEFINEVLSIGRTSHVNIITLFGFCYEKSKRALVYDYMPNGSLDKFIFNKNPQNTNPCLEWRLLYNIAVGIARGLEYLHRGCKTRILHFDIKPQNILLDKDFCPKISDFGLAKLWLKKDSIMSLMGARGTAGYIAPEVFSRNYGGVSHKSDVYSYGMLVLEMVGGGEKFDTGVSHTSEVFYSHWIYEDMQAGNDASIFRDATEEDKEILRKMILVSFWCIQTHPDDRPSMTKVVEMLEGTLQSLEIPPKPFLFSPKRSPQRSTTMAL